MTNRIYYGSQALLLKSCTKDAGMTNYFIPGVQAVGLDGDVQSIAYSTNGRIQEYGFQYLPSTHDITIDRVLGVKDVFWLELSSNFLRNENRSNFTYLNTRLVNKNIYGNTISDWATGDESVVKAANIPEYRFWLMLDPNENGIIESMTGNSGTIQDVIDINNCLMYNLSYNFDINGFFTESISLTSKTKEYTNNTSFTLDTISGLTNPVTYNSLLKRQHVYNNLSLYPNIIETLINFNQFFNGQEVFGIKNIKIDLGLSYDMMYNGKIPQGDKSNVGTSLNFPLNVSCTFTITARRMPQLILDETGSGLYQQDVIILENGDILLLEDDSYVSIQADNDSYQRIAIVAGIQDGSNIKFFIIDLGSKNRLTSFSQTGGSTDGSIVEYEITFINTNDFMTYTQVQSSDTVLNPPLVEQTTEKY